MNGKFIIYALLVTVFATATSWGRMFAASANSGSGSSWSARTHGGGGSYGGGVGGGGGHK